MKYFLSILFISAIFIQDQYCQDINNLLTFIYINDLPKQHHLDSSYEYWPEYPVGWHIARKIYYSYDNNGNRIGRYGKSWDSGGNYDASYHFQYMFNDEYISEAIGPVYDSTYSQYTLRYCYTYDIDGNCTEEVRERWDESKDTWQNSLYHKLKWDQYSNLIEYSFLSWNSELEVWVKVGKFVYEFDQENRLIRDYGQGWDNVNEEWKREQGQNLYLYGENNLEINKLQQIWDTTYGSWINITKEIFTYDNSGNEINRLCYRWDEAKSDYYITGQDLYEYDLDGNETRKTVQFWDTLTTQWTNDQQLIKTYNSNGNMLEKIEQRWYDVGPWYDVGWVNNFRWKYFWNDLGTPIGRVGSTNENILYPNPALDYFLLDLRHYEDIKRVELITVSGRIIRTYIPDNLKSLVVHRDGLAPGVYFIKIVGLNSHVKKVLFE